MVLLAAYSEAGEPLPQELPKEWKADPVLRRVGDSGRASYHSLYFTQLWFPVSNMVVFNARTPADKSVRIASVPWLRHHLTQLNTQTLGGSPAALDL
jgi:hypothetical protein